MLYNWDEKDQREELIEEFRDILAALTQDVANSDASFPYDFNSETEMQVRECVVHLAFEYKDYPTSLILMAALELLSNHPDLNIDMLFVEGKN